MGISLWRACARNVRIALFHAQDSARPIRAAAWRNAPSWRSFSRSVGVPAETFATPRRASQALRPDGETGGATIGSRRAQVLRRQSKGPNPARIAARRFAVRSPDAARRLADGVTRRTERPASVPRPALPGRSSRAPKARRTGAAGRTREGASAPRAGSLRRPRRGGSRNGRPNGRAKRSGRRQDGSIRGKAGLAKGRAGTGRRQAFLAGTPSRGDDAKRVSPWGSGSRSAGTSDGSCGSGVRPAPEASGGVLPGTRAVLFREDRAT